MSRLPILLDARQAIRDLIFPCLQAAQLRGGVSPFFLFLGIDGGPPAVRQFLYQPQNAVAPLVRGAPLVDRLSRGGPHVAPVGAAQFPDSEGIACVACMISNVVRGQRCSGGECRPLVAAIKFNILGESGPAY